MEITLKNITKNYGDLVAIDDISLRCKEGELIALLGPSGCGKTTLLRVLAGLIPLTKGEIYFDETEITSWSAQKRNSTMVFQNYALFPHLNVEKNIAYGLKVRKVSNAETKRRVSDVLKQVELNGYEKRKIQELSGGQKQRVALARALVVQPNILLFDEPLSNLDEKLRVSMRQEIRKIQKEIGITSIYVTHDQGEAMAIADRIVVMNKGKIEQIVDAKQLYNKPENSFVASFIGHQNLIELPVKKNNKEQGLITIFGKEIIIDNKRVYDSQVVILIPPEEICVSKKGIKGKVISYENLGAIHRYIVSTSDHDLVIDILNNRSHKVLEINEPLYFEFDKEAVQILYC